MRRLRKDDLVQVIAGKDRGARGRVVKVIPEVQRVLVEGVNKAIVHRKPSQQYPEGGRIELERPIHISNVMPVDPSTDKPTRVRIVQGQDTLKKKRVAVRSGADL